MTTKTIIAAALACCATLPAVAQKIDFDSWTTDTRYTETGYEQWNISKCTSATKDFTDALGNTVTVTVSSTPGKQHIVKCNWWKDGVQKYSVLVGDALCVYGLDENDNTPQLTSESATMTFTVSGLTAGQHTLLAYMNVTDGGITSVAPIDVAVDGQTVLTDVTMTARAQKASDAAQAYVTFTATEGKDVTIAFTSKPEAGKTYSTSGIFVNALVFDRANPVTTALNPYPENEDMHADADTRQITLSWTAAPSAVSHHVYLGTSEADMTLQGTTTEAEYTVKGLTPHNVYYWRVDEEDASGTVYEGDTWTFRPRRLAFPGAEGYGRYAIGGRGGSVYHVTSLDDNPDDPQPGTFRYGLTKATGPRTIVFDVSGTIHLTARLTCSDKYVTIAGQTAPGKGILFRGAPIGVANDGITRFVRNRRGFHNDDEADIARGLDGLGMAGNNHSIMDHCSVGWTIDEAFSSRNAKNMTLQRTLISEALNQANHPNYDSGTKHGYAATIGGDVGSYHHNLLAHNEGRNWSLSGGLDGGGAYAGAHDIFNNVVYNWGGRATDGGTHHGQFVANYYKMGPSTSQKKLLVAQFEGTGTGTQEYYVSGNIRENKNGSITKDKEGDTYSYSKSGGQVLDWEPWASTPYFDSHATVETAEKAFKTVLSDVGANEPYFDEHDQRMVTETLNGTTSAKGSKTGKKGLIDRETDSEGYSYFPTADETRPDGFDTDQDGMPDWWETLMGLNPNLADNNADDDGDGYTALEDYLNWLAEPHYEILSGAQTTIDLTTLFAGYDNSPMFTCENTLQGYDITITGTTLKVTAPQNTDTLASIKVTADDSDNVGSMTRTINLRIKSGTDGINPATISIGDDSHTTWQVYALDGTKMHDGRDISSLPAGVYILKATNNGRTTTFKTVKK